MRRLPRTPRASRRAAPGPATVVVVVRPWVRAAVWLVAAAKLCGLPERAVRWCMAWIALHGTVSTPLPKPPRSR